MKVTTSIIWCIFTVIFIVLGFAHLQEVDNTIPPFAVPKFAPQGASITLGTAENKVGLEEPVRLFVKDFNQHLKSQDKANATANSRAAFGYFAAALTALVSLLLVWEQDICRRFRKQKPVETG